MGVPFLYAVQGSGIGKSDAYARARAVCQIDQPGMRRAEYRSEEQPEGEQHGSHDRNDTGIEPVAQDAAEQTSENVEKHDGGRDHRNGGNVPAEMINDRLLENAPQIHDADAEHRDETRDDRGKPETRPFGTHYLSPRE